MTPPEPRHHQHEQTFWKLVRSPGLDERVRAEPNLVAPLRQAIDEAVARAWSPDRNAADEQVASERLLTQRLLYGINRLRLFWFDDPSNYANERSRVLADLAEQLEAAWQEWLRRQVPDDGLDSEDVASTLRAWMERDRTPLPSADHQFFAETIDLSGYRRLLEIASLNGLVEASQLSRTLGGAAHPVQATLTRILVEEYGGGKLPRKHSTFFAEMLQQAGLSPEPEAYFDRVPWEVLAAINHAFFLAENKRHYVRFCGAFTYTEVSTPVSFRGFAAAAKRLGFAEDGRDYWSLHIREDERHGQWMVEEVAIPLALRFPERRHELLFGYAQQRVVEAMAAQATARECRAAMARSP